MKSASISLATGATSFTVAFALAAGPGPGAAQSSEQLERRVVIASNVACRTQPDPSAPSAVRYDVGDAVHPRDRHESADGVWYFDTVRSRGCWIFGGLTADWSDAVAGLVAAADRILARTDRPTLEEVVAVDNFLVQTKAGAHSETRHVELSPLVQLRRLQVLALAAETSEARSRRVREQPLESAWFFTNRDVLSYHIPGGVFVVTAETYWRLFERHRDTEWAEEIAWAAAQGALIRDECDGPCRLRGLLQTFAGYWSRYPDGRWIDQALERAVSIAGYAVRAGCRYSGPEETQEVASELRETLQSVDAPGRDELLAQVTAIEEACAPPPQEDTP